MRGRAPAFAPAGAGAIDDDFGEGGALSRSSSRAAREPHAADINATDNASSATRSRLKGFIPSMLRLSRQLILERVYRVGEHLPVRRCAGPFEIGARPGEGQFHRAAFRQRVALVLRQRATDGLRALGLRLLELDVLALEASRHPCLQYSTGMDRMRDPVARRPAIDVAARTDRLRHSLRFSPGPLTAALRESGPAAVRAAEQLWRADPAAWSSEPAVQQKIANRLGWMRSPALMAGHVDRIMAFAD